jgi:hypothetical protein
MPLPRDSGKIDEEHARGGVRHPFHKGEEGRSVESLAGFEITKELPFLKDAAAPPGVFRRIGAETLLSRLAWPSSKPPERGNVELVLREFD